METLSSAFRQRIETWNLDYDKPEVGNPRETEDRQHRDPGKRSLQARVAQPDDPGRSAAKSRQCPNGRRSLYIALHSRPRGPEPDERVPRPWAPPAQGGGGVP